MKLFRISRRFLFFVLITAATVVTIYLRRLFLRADLRDAMRIRRKWARLLMHGVGVRIQTEGEIPVEPCLVVSNHRSYLDPILLLCYLDAFPVAKAELAQWPLLGKGARLAGILYLKRESANSRAAILREMSNAILTGYQVILFPEGTTSELPTGVLSFKKGSFGAAAQEGFPVVPAALCFAETADFWVGKDTFLQHAGRRFREKEIRVKIVFGPLIKSPDSGELLEKSKVWIEQQLAQRPPR